MRSILGVVAILMVLLVPSVSAYEITWYNDNSSANGVVIAPSLSSNLQCVATLNANINATKTGAFVSDVEFYSPHANVQAFNEFGGTNTVICQNGIAGSADSSTLSSQGHYESSLQYSDDAATRTVYLSTDFDCSGNNLMVYNFSHNDTYGYIPNIIYGAERETVGSPTIAGLKTEHFAGQFAGNSSGYCQTYPSDGAWGFNNFGRDFGLFKNGTEDITGVFTIRRNNYFAILFNSTNGEFSYDVDYSAVTMNGTGSCPLYKTAFYRWNDPSAITTLSTAAAASGTQSVIENQWHVFVAGVYCAGGGTADAVFINNPINNFSVDVYVPQYACGDYGSCVNGTQYRTCEDLNGVDPDKIESRSCFSGVYEEEILGFEGGETATVLECKRNWLNSVDYQNITVTLPANWTILQNTVNDSRTGDYVWHTRNAEIVADPTAPEGTSSMKMWFIPPLIDQVTQVNEATGEVQCQNNTNAGFVPIINQTVLNTTVTFPTESSIISWNVRKFSAPYKQYDTNSIFANPEELCHAENCSAEVGGNYNFILSDDVTGANVLNLNLDAPSEDWTSYRVSAEDLIIGRDYSLRFAVNLEDQFAVVGHGIYLDNVKISNGLAPLSESCIEGSECDGDDLIITVLDNITCRQEVIESSPSCIGTEEEELIENITTPASGLDDLINFSYYEEAGLGFVPALFSPFFLASGFMLIVSLLAEFFVRSGGIVFGFIILFLTIGMTIIGVYPIGFAIAFVVLGGFVLMHTVMKSFKGGV